MKIGFIGLGGLGTPMALNIIQKSDFEVMVFDENPDNMQKLIEMGAPSASSLSQITNGCNVIITMTSGSQAAKELYAKLLPLINPGTILIDMSIIDPLLSIQLSLDANNQGSIMLDAPVVKGQDAAEKGELGIYVGGDYRVYEKVLPILECMGSNIIHLGQNGKGHAMRICHNMLLSHIQNGVSEMLVLAQGMGIDIEDVSKAISYGDSQNQYLENKNHALKAGDFTPCITLKDMDQDIQTAITLSKNLGLRLPTTLDIEKVYQDSINQGLGDLDFSAAMKVVKKNTGFEV